MNPQTPIPSDAELEAMCVELATGAARLVADARAGQDGITVDSKSTATDLVTDVDRRSEAWLLEQLTRLRPADAVLAEEGASHDGTSGVRWVLDPIDGTVNFVLGLPLYAVSVAVEVDGDVAAGAVCNPASGELFQASRSGPARLDGAQLGARRSVPLARAVIGTGFAYDPAMRERQMRVAAPLLPRVGDLRRLGSAALDLCFVAAGRLDGYFEVGLNPWDYAAGGLIARRAGCVTSGLRGAAPGSRMYAAAPADLAPELFGVLEALAADRVSSSPSAGPASPSTDPPS
ncbi:inositol monophosphatase family protein [uncultured Jatrophihabitans sp.]|uniref:inositol monophosphatase family protein n=1 Tax=uncultured Jatrophihabitans sp. TaxID=1610747 RepID=UPI0035CC4314